MPQLGSCPPVESWQRYVRGSVTEDEARLLEEHLAECRSCLEKLKALSVQDEFALAVDGQPGVSTSIGGDQPGLEPLLQRLKELRPTLPYFKHLRPNAFVPPGAPPVASDPSSD